MTEHRALCGWLLKQDAKSLWKGWKKRWFQQLHDYHLYYFPTCTTDISLSKGYIDLKSVLHVQVDPLLKDKFGFNIVTQDRTYVLQASSADEVEYWMTGLNAIVASLSQPLTALISKAELFEIQQQHSSDQRKRSTTQSAKPSSSSAASYKDHPRAMSMRYPPLTHSQSSGEMKISNINRSNSMQNITYIEYDNTPPPSSSLSSSASINDTNNNTNNISGSATIASFPSLQESTPPNPPALTTSKSTPVTPVKSSASASMPFLDIISNHSTKEQDVEKEKQEKKKWASMKDIQALIVREKDAEIARLTIEVARVNEMHEKAIDSTKLVRQELHMQLERQRIEEAEKIADVEKKYTVQIEELRSRLNRRDKELEQKTKELEEATRDREETIVEFEKLKHDTGTKINILESEIKLKENVIVRLNSTITSLNGELSAKDSLLEDSIRGITYPQVFDDTLTVAQLEKERETRHALQEQCAFLGQELFKLETELKQHKILIAEQKNKILERSSSTGNSSSMASFAGASSYASFADLSTVHSPSSSSDQDNTQFNILLVENESLRQKYFMSVGRSLKLQTTMTGGFSNLSIADLYDQAVHLKLKIEEWPNFISDQLAESLKGPT